MKNDFANKLFTITREDAIGDDENNKEEKEDYVEKSIGAFGLWQAVVCVIAALSRNLSQFNMLSILFLTPTTSFKCSKFEDNTTLDTALTVQNSTCYDKCLKYEYESIVFNSSLISDFDLICDRAWLASFTQTALMFGLLLGTFLFGWYADRFGRRSGFLLSGFVNIVLMLAAPFAPDYWTFTILRFFIGIASGGTLVISSVYVIEVVGKKYREIAGSCALMPDGITEASLAIFAYFSSTWNTYVLGYSVLCILILLNVAFLPESPRWLMSMRKDKDALRVMTNAAKRNKMATNNIKGSIEKGISDMKTVQHEAAKVTYVDMFRTKDFAIKTVSVFLIWTILGTSYFGISQHMTFIVPDVYMVVVVLGLIQVPGSFVAMYVNRIYGRKATIIATFLVTTVTMVVLIFTPEGHWGITVLGIIGICANSVTFYVAVVFVAELYPTPLRSMSCGVASAGSLVGGMIAPFIVNITPQWVPSLILAILPVLGSLNCIILPETKGVTLQDTIS